MRLISCHIENFGKLHDCTIDFSNGANMICQENGWGKSTFAAFLRAMFYGLEGERKRSIEENEYKRYAPWQGGVFGGQLTFEVGEKQYIVTRTFHEQEEFELRDAKTNLISHDYSSKLGEELFKVNRESFMRTLFIGQADCETAVTDDVNAKIGNLTENANDMNSFEAANTRLKELMNRLTPSRKTGSISQRKHEITELERKVVAGNGIPNALQSVQEKWKEEVEKHKRLTVELEGIQKEQIRVSKLEAVGAKKEQWDSLKCELQKAREKFQEEVPTMEEVGAAQLHLSEMDKASERVTTYEMTEGEKEQLASLDILFEKEIPSEDEIAKELNKVKTLGVLRTELLKEQVNQASKKNPSTLWAGGAVAVLGILIALVGISMTMVAVTGVGLAVAFAGILIAIVGNLNQKKLVQSEHAQKESEATQMQQSIRAFLEKFHIYVEEEAFTNQLHELKSQVSKYAFLQNKKQNLLAAQKVYEQNNHGVKDFLIKYGFEVANNLQVQLMHIRDHVQTYMEARRSLKMFEQGNDISALNIENQEGAVSLSELNEQMRELTKQRNESHERIDGYRVDLEKLQVQYDEWEENKMRLEELRDLQDSEMQKYHYIQKVQEYLGRAKESITNKYSAPILESFKTYYELIVSETIDDFRMDANINITKVEQGKQREINTLSSGYRDLIGLCLRVALVDAMYTDETPILIMDDPFTNLDDGKMRQAKQFLEYVAKKYQVIYFTCSDARK